MRFLRVGGLALTLCTLASPAWTQTGKVSHSLSNEAEYNALLKHYNNALSRFYKLFEKVKTDKESQKLQSDKTKNPAFAYLPRFQTLARRAYPNETGAKALLEVMQIASSTHDTKAVAAAANSLVADYSHSPLLPKAAEQIGIVDWQIDVAQPAQLLQNMVDHCAGRMNKAAAMYSLACLYTGGHGATPAQKAKAKTLFAQLTADYSDTPYAKRTAGFVFQLENLQVGMTAPDFEATDTAGKRFKLSDYRGKVVVLDFWGFW